ncbi:MAG: hypothetical protein LBI92_02085 [Azoarcus sp.]|nr:hypothetical protein [Azoarcus sp.]
MFSIPIDGGAHPAAVFRRIEHHIGALQLVGGKAETLIGPINVPPERRVAAIKGNSGKVIVVQQQSGGNRNQHSGAVNVSRFARRRWRTLHPAFVRQRPLQDFFPLFQQIDSTFIERLEVFSTERHILIFPGLECAVEANGFRAHRQGFFGKLEKRDEFFFHLCRTRQGNGCIADVLPFGGQNSGMSSGEQSQ